jgi:hypothetical protein
MLKKIAKNLISAILLGSISFSPLLANPKRAQAQAAVLVAGITDPASMSYFLAENLARAGYVAAAKSTALASLDSSFTETADLGQKIMEWVETLFTETLRDALLGYLTDQVVAYISGNADGIYIGNWQEYLSGVAMTELQGVIKEVADVDICAPFSLQLKVMLAPPPVDSFKKKITCTFDKVGANFDDFISDFKKGGWIAYDSAFSPENNIYGVFLAGSLEQAGRVQQGKERALAEGIAGSGFLGSKECTDPKDPNSCTIKTPGSVAAKAVTKAVVDTPFDRIVGAKNLANFVSAVTNALIGRALKEGLAALQPSTNDPSNINNYVNQKGVEKTVSQRYRSELSRLSKKVSEAIKEREAANDFANSADTKWLKYPHGATNIVREAADQIAVAKKVLSYSLGEVNKVIYRSQIKSTTDDGNENTNTQTEKLCKPVRNLSAVDNTAIPRLRGLLNRAAEALDTFEIADDDFPDADPEFVVVSKRVREINQSNEGTNSDFFAMLSESSKESLGISDSEIDPTEEDNLDQLAILKELQYQIDNEMAENTEQTRFRLGELQSLVGSNVAAEARIFKDSMKGIDDDIEKVFKNASAYANRLRGCFSPRDEQTPKNGVVVGWEPNDPGDESVGRPPRDPGFPWETDQDTDPDTTENLAE